MEPIYIEWKTGNPPKDGYYLAAWKRSGKWAVSELWFNPDSIGTGWWPTRGYFGQDNSCLRDTINVVAWMPLPEYKPK